MISLMVWPCLSAARRPWSRCGWKEPVTTTSSSTASTWNACAGSSARKWLRSKRTLQNIKTCRSFRPGHIIVLTSINGRHMWKANRQNSVLEGLFFYKLQSLSFHQPGAEFSTEKTSRLHTEKIRMCERRSQERTSGHLRHSLTVDFFFCDHDKLYVI